MSILHLSCSQKLCCPQNVQSNPHEWFRVIETATAQDQNPDCKTQIYALQVQTDSITAETGVTVSWIQSKSCGGFAAPLLADWSVSSCLSHFYLLKQIRCESNSVLISPEENGVPPDSMTNPVFLTSLQGKWLASTLFLSEMKGIFFPVWELWVCIYRFNLHSTISTQGGNKKWYAFSVNPVHPGKWWSDIRDVLGVSA